MRQWATGRENPKLQNWNEESAVQRGVRSALCTSGVCRKLAAKFATFSDMFCTPCFTQRFPKVGFCEGGRSQ